MRDSTTRRRRFLVVSSTILAAVCAVGIGTLDADQTGALRAWSADRGEGGRPGQPVAVAAEPDALAVPDVTRPAAPRQQAAAVTGPGTAPATGPAPAPPPPAAEPAPAADPTGPAPTTELAGGQAGDPTSPGPATTLAAAVDRSATTGVTAGATLVPMAGGTISSSGVIANRVITGDVVFTGSDLTVRNVRVTGHAVFRGDDVIIEDAEFGSWALSGTERVRAARVEVFGNPGQDGLHVTADTGPVRDVVVADSWIHNPLIANGSHYDGIQVRGVDGLTVRNVVIDLGAYASGQNAAVFLENANGGNRDVLVDGSWLLGGGYTVVSYATNAQITGTAVRAGRWGYLNPDSWALTTFRDNTADGAGALVYDGRVVTVSSGPVIVECWPSPEAAVEDVAATAPPAP